MANLETPITTQEQFDSAIGERLKRERETLEKKYEEKYAGYISKKDHDKAIEDTNKQLNDLTEKLAGSDKTIQGLKSQVKSYQTSAMKAKIAHDVGLPYGLASRLTGDDEEKIKADAEKLMEIVGKRGNASNPPASTAPAGTNNDKKAGYKTLLNSLTEN